MTDLSSVTSETPSGDGDPFYVFKASLAGAPFALWLRRDGIEWNLGRRSGLLRYDKIRRIRLAYRPATMQSHRFTTEIWSDDLPKFQIVSTSWTGIVMQQRQDGPYAAFITELHRRIAATGAKVRFQSGMPIVPFAIGMVVVAVGSLAFAALVKKAVELAEWRSLLVIGGVFALFGWQLGSYFYRNRPGEYHPEAIPPYVLPRFRPSD